MAASSVSTSVHDQLRTLVTGRTVVLATADRAAGESVLRRLHELGAGRILVLGPPGLAPPAATVDAELVEIHLGMDAEDENPETTQRRWEAMLDDPPPGLRNLVDARDPDRTALILVSPWFATTELLGRPVFGTQRPGWDGYEDRLLAERLWDEAVVAATSDAACRATGR